MSQDKDACYMANATRLIGDIPTYGLCLQMLRALPQLCDLMAFD